MKIKAVLHFLVAIAFLSISPLVIADQFYMVVDIQCNKTKSELLISFNGAWNENGEQMILAAHGNKINTWDLVSITEDESRKYHIVEKPISRRCRLNGNEYRIDVSPFMVPDFHPEGHCSTRMGAWVKVYLGSRRLISRGTDACTVEATVTTSMLVRPHKPVIYRQVEGEKFYDGE